ncbi:hypothetical protein VTJ83DRAFT_5038 [Remersonia thermophila]|uniref:Probable electron transfer flavoprotein subunit alpha n=1 Tax=Remersonia thermophila TaxID=72144 RepID=A0ABR4DBN7_9PEZI
MLAAGPRRAISALARPALRAATTPSPLTSPAALRRFLSALAILEQRDGKIVPSSLSAVTAAKQLGGSVHAFVAGGDVSGAASEAARAQGVDKVVAVDKAPAYDRGLPESFAPLVAENVKKGGYTHVVAAHSAFGKNVLPRVAALLDAQQVSDVTAIQDDKTFVRPIYAGNAVATVESSDPIKVVTVRGTAFPPAPVAGDEGAGAAAVEAGVDPKVESPTEWVSEDLAKSDRPDLGTASRVVSGGRGLKSKEEFERIMLPLADSLGAAVGASRAAVDSGYADNSLQVGQTGKVVAPQLYVAVGISGAIQHLAGMKDSKVIAAINKDPDAPIFQVADVGLVGDLFEKVPELTEKVKKA